MIHVYDVAKTMVNPSEAVYHLKRAGSWVRTQPPSCPTSLMSLMMGWRLISEQRRGGPLSRTYAA